MSTSCEWCGTRASCPECRRAALRGGLPACAVCAHLGRRCSKHPAPESTAIGRERAMLDHADAVLAAVENMEPDEAGNVTFRIHKAPESTAIGPDASTSALVASGDAPAPFTSAQAGPEPALECSEGVGSAEPSPEGAPARPNGASVPSGQHRGGPTCYAHGCRLPECRAAWATRARELRRARGAQPRPDGPSHGTRRRYAAGCKCSLCRAWQAAAMRAYRARRASR